MEQAILIIILVGLLFWGIVKLSPIILGCFLCWCIYASFMLLFEYFYFNSEEFLKIKNDIEKNKRNFNELNKHIEDLKKAYINVKSKNQCNAEYYDKNSSYNFKRPHIKDFVSDEYIYYCSLSVCRNAEIEPFKYFCKYFNVETDENTLQKFEDVFNQFSSAEEGVILLKKERDEILNSISDKVPFIIYKFRQKNLLKKLGFDEVKTNDIFYPKYSFVYISAGGNSKMCTDIIFDTSTLEDFIEYLGDIVKFKKSAKYQRALMTSNLRDEILERDNYTCKICGLSTRDEPNLLLEIDHIIPISKGGITTEENLQTLCWRCNRSKSNKLL